MTQDDDTVELSRRKILGGLGTIGIASAGAGLGTSAFFSDEESFENNTLQAGRLDLLTDYNIVYEGGPGRKDQLDSLYAGEEYNMNGVENMGDGRYLLDQVPAEGTPDDWVTGANNDDFEPEDLTDAGFPLFNLTDVKPGDYGEATISLHLFDNDGHVWMNGSLERNAQNGINEVERETLENSDEFVPLGQDDPGLYEEPNDDGQRYYFDPDLENAAQDSDWGGQLADLIEAKTWYDANCNNSHDTEEGDPIDLVFVIDVSNSMGMDDGQDQTRLEELKGAAQSLVDSLRTDINGQGADDRVGIVEFASFDNEVIGLTNASDEQTIEDAIDGLDPYTDDVGGTNYEAGIYAGRNVLENGDPNREQVMLVLGDGAPTARYDTDYSTWQGWSQSDKENNHITETGPFDEDAQDAAIGAANSLKNETDVSAVTVGFRLDESSEQQNAIDTLEDIASTDEEDENTKLFYSSPTAVNLETILSQIGESLIVGETVIAEGSLREVLEELSGGYHLEPDRLEEEDGDDSCFTAGLTYCIGFEWWLPEDVGNEVQTDVVEFDIDFAAVQCRHNDEPTNPFAA